MEALAICSRVLLASLMAVAAVSKAVARPSFQEAVTALGVRPRYARTVSWAVPAAELALAVGLLLTPIAPTASGGAGLLLATFSALLAWNLLNGRRPACNCFGSQRAKPISWSSVVRNLGLIALAVVGTLSNVGVPEWLHQHIASSDLAQLAAAFGAALLLFVASGYAAARARWTTPRRAETNASSPVRLVRGGRSVGPLSVRELPVGSPDPSVPLLVVRVDPSCGPCHALVPRLRAWQDAYAGVLEIAAVTAATRDEAGEYAELRHVILDHNDEVVQALDLAVTPSAVIITTNNEIGSGVAEGAIEIGNLLTEVALDGRGVLERGDPVGATILPSHRGILSMADLTGSMTLLTFWDPWCGYCQAFLPELRAREMGLGSSQRLVVAVQGTPEVAEVLGFETSAHDTDGSVMRRFGGYGTPSAVLVDAAGRVCSDIAHGRDEIIALADRSDHLSALAAATS